MHGGLATQGNEIIPFTLPSIGPSQGLIVLIEHQFAPSLKEAEIKAITLSDHAPVKIQLEILGDALTGKNWKLNDSLIQDPESIKG